MIGETTPTSIPRDRVAVVVSRFPKFTETFVVDAILGLEQEGCVVDVFPLLPVTPAPHQPSAKPLVNRAVYGPMFGWAPLASLCRTSVQQPLVLIGIVATLIREAWQEPDMVFKDLAALPRICVIADQIVARGVTHVHAHFASRAGFAALAIGRLTGVPFSIVGHGSDIHKTQRMLAVKAREAETMILISEFNRQVVEDVCSSDESNLHVVRCGVNVSSFSPVNRGPIPKAPRLLCVGTLHEVKGQRFLIEAIDCLRQRGVESTLQLIGDGDDFGSLAQLARDLGLSTSITFSGALPRADVLKAYGEADIVVCPSAPSNDGRKEGIPVVLMEAMATGAPVVASRLAGIPELVEDGVTGLLADPASSVSLADRIECLVTDPGLAARLGQQGRLRVEQEFSAPRNAAMVAALIRGHGDPAVGRTLPEAPARQGVI